MIRIRSGKWQLTASPSCGGNLARVTWQGIDIMRPFDTAEDWREAPTNFGFAVLFPPNRIADGRFTFGGRPCFLPVNEPARANHLHGIALREPWQCVQTTDDSVTMEMIFDPSSPMYEGYPFDCRLRVVYRVCGDELEQRFEVENRSDGPIPCALGFHSAFAAPRRLKVHGTGRQIELQPPRYRASGREIDWTDGFAPSAWCDPAAIWPFGHFRTTAEPLAELDYGDHRVVYRPDPAFRYWMVWRPVDDTSFVCVEPMNIKISTFENDPVSLPTAAAGETVTFTSKITISEV